MAKNITKHLCSLIQILEKYIGIPNKLLTVINNNNIIQETRQFPNRSEFSRVGNANPL